MEILLLLIPVGIFVLAYFLRGDRGFTAPEVSPIAKADLSGFEAAPSLWVNRAEETCFAILRRHLPTGFHLHGKVRLEDIIRVQRGVPAKTRWALRGRVKSRHVDYLITSPSGRPVLAIELDGSAHDPKNPSEADAVKTALFRAAGVSLRRIRVGEDFDLIAATIAKELRPY